MSDYLYFNTTGEPDDKVEEYMNINRSQKAIIWNFIRNSYVVVVEKKGFTASEVWNLCTGLNSRVPLTSVRRALTQLCEDGRLQKGPEKKMGPYNRNEYVYKIKEEEA